jgi:hypothetical protein
MKKYKKTPKFSWFEGNVHYAAEKQDFWELSVVTAIKITVMRIEYLSNINVKLILLQWIR